MTRSIPSSASVVHAQEGAKLHAPSAARNADVLTGFLAKHAPQTGHALEIASGTGQHIVTFARALPALNWQPTDIDAERLRSIDAYAVEARAENIAKAVFLNATAPGWGMSQGPQDLVVLVNLLHLISDAETRTLMKEVAVCLNPGGTFIFYGPFKRAGQLVSEGDVNFDHQLRTADPAIGYKDTLDIQRWLEEAGLAQVQSFEMPANNLAFVARKPAA